MTETLQLLQQLADLLTTYGRRERSEYVRSLIAAGESDDLWAAVAGLEFWGGSGAVWEVEPFHYSHPNRPDSEADYRRFQQLMIQLGKSLEDRDMAASSSRTVSMFERQLESEA